MHTFRHCKVFRTFDLDGSRIWGEDLSVTKQCKETIIIRQPLDKLFWYAACFFYFFKLLYSMLLRVSQGSAKERPYLAFIKTSTFMLCCISQYWGPQRLHRRGLSQVTNRKEAKAHCRDLLLLAAAEMHICCVLVRINWMEKTKWTFWQNEKWCR